MMEFLVMRSRAETPKASAGFALAYITGQVLAVDGGMAMA
jgi:hypothetical protein